MRWIAWCIAMHQVSASFAMTWQRTCAHPQSTACQERATTNKQVCKLELIRSFNHEQRAARAEARAAGCSPGLNNRTDSNDVREVGNMQHAAPTNFTLTS
jgi:hypothetical protein